MQNSKWKWRPQGQIDARQMFDVADFVAVAVSISVIGHLGESIYVDFGWIICHLQRMICQVLYQKRSS